MPSSKRDIKDKLKKLKKPPPPLPPQTSESDSSEDETIYVTDSSSSTENSSIEEIHTKSKRKNVVESSSENNSGDDDDTSDSSESEEEIKRKKSKKSKKNKKWHKTKYDKKGGSWYDSEDENKSSDDSSSDDNDSEEDSKKKKKPKNAYSLILSIGKDGDFEDDDDFDEDDDDDYDEDTEDEVCNSDDEKTFMKENYEKIAIPIYPEKEAISSKQSENKKESKNSKTSKKGKESKQSKDDKSKKSQSKESDEKGHHETKDEEKTNVEGTESNENDNIESEYMSLIELKKDFIEKLKKNPKNKIIRQAIEGCDESIKALVKSSRKKNTVQYKKLIKKENNKTDEFDYFKKKLSNKEQLTIMKDLEEINGHICIEKPYRLTLLQSKIPAKYKAIAMQKLNLLKMLVPGDPEYCKLKNWVDCFMKIPFGNYKNLSINLNDGVDVCNNFLKNAKETLDNCVYGLEDAKIQIMQMLGQWMTNPSSLGTAIAIKGPPGTGKCHTYNTPILMYDGTTKMVQDIKIGDVIMGDDSTPRNVLSLGSGMDMLYNICLKNGVKYGVNSHHILCLKNEVGYVDEIMVKDYLNTWAYNTRTFHYMPNEIITDTPEQTKNIQNILDNMGIQYTKIVFSTNSSVRFAIEDTDSKFSIEKIGYGQYYGFEIDGNHRYLLGNMYVTHNTSLVKEGISKILGREFTFIALGGASDSSFLEGHSYTYEGSSWGKIVQILIDSKCMNPVIYFDELDKISDTPKGQEIVGILTHLTDTSQNSEFHDKYFFEMEFDLSKCLFIFSYNNEELVNPILKDRMYRIQTKGYNAKDKVIIAKKYLLPKIRAQVNFNETDIIIPDDVIEYIINKQSLTKSEDGVRNLKRCLEIIYTKLNLFRLITPENQIFKSHIDIEVTFPFTVSKKHVDILIKPEENDLPKSLLTMYI